MLRIGNQTIVGTSTWPTNKNASLAFHMLLPSIQKKVLDGYALEKLIEWLEQEKEDEAYGVQGYKKIGGDIMATAYENVLKHIQETKDCINHYMEAHGG